MQGKEVIPQEEYTEKLGAAIDARENKDFIIVARTDSRAIEGLEAAIERGIQNKKTGADAVFIEAPRSLDEMKKIGKEIKSPLVANMIEGGATPMNSAQTLNKIGFNIILYPLSVLFANTFATMNILQELKNTGTTAKYKQKVVNFDQFNNLVELDKFKKMETKYKFSKRK
jgi:methylisocitrate lyase